MGKINKMLGGEALCGDGNEIAHIDLIMGPRGSAAETAFADCLNQQQGRLHQPTGRSGAQLAVQAGDCHVQQGHHQ